MYLNVISILFTENFNYVCIRCSLPHFKSIIFLSHSYTKNRKNTLRHIFQHKYRVPRALANGVELEMETSGHSQDPENFCHVACSQFPPPPGSGNLHSMLILAFHCFKIFMPGKSYSFYALDLVSFIYIVCIVFFLVCFV